MTLTKELLAAQLTQAMSRRDEIAASLNAQIGAINQLQNLLQVLELPEPASAKPTAGSPPAKPTSAPSPGPLVS